MTAKKSKSPFRASQAVADQSHIASAQAFDDALAEYQAAERAYDQAGDEWDAADDAARWSVPTPDELMRWYDDLPVGALPDAGEIVARHGRTDEAQRLIGILGRHLEARQAAAAAPEVEALREKHVVARERFHAARDRLAGTPVPSLGALAQKMAHLSPYLDHARPTDASELARFADPTFDKPGADRERAWFALYFDVLRLAGLPLPNLKVLVRARNYVAEWEALGGTLSVPPDGERGLASGYPPASEGREALLRELGDNEPLLSAIIDILQAEW